MGYFPEQCERRTARKQIRSVHSGLWTFFPMGLKLMQVTYFLSECENY